MSAVVSLKYDPAWVALDWAKKHCRSYITNVQASAINYPAGVKINYYFASERDAFLFKLRWSDQVV
jgi:hypothetical protein